MVAGRIQRATLYDGSLQDNQTSARSLARLELPVYTHPKRLLPPAVDQFEPQILTARLLRLSEKPRTCSGRESPCAWNLAWNNLSLAEQRVKCRSNQVG